MATEMATQMALLVAADSASHVATDLASQMIAVLATEMTTARHDSLCSSGRGARPFGTWRDGVHGWEEGFLSNLDALRVAQAGGLAFAFVGQATRSGQSMRRTSVSTTGGAAGHELARHADRSLPSSACCEPALPPCVMTACASRHWRRRTERLLRQ